MPMFVSVLPLRILRNRLPIRLTLFEASTHIECFTQWMNWDASTVFIGFPFIDYGTIVTVLPDVRDKDHNWAWPNANSLYKIIFKGSNCSENMQHFQACNEIHIAAWLYWLLRLKVTIEVRGICNKYLTALQSVAEFSCHSNCCNRECALCLIIEISVAWIFWQFLNIVSYNL